MDMHCRVVRGCCLIDRRRCFSGYSPGYIATWVRCSMLSWYSAMDVWICKYWCLYCLQFQTAKLKKGWPKLQAIIVRDLALSFLDLGDYGMYACLYTAQGIALFIINRAVCALRGVLLAAVAIRWNAGHLCRTAEITLQPTAYIYLSTRIICKLVLHCILLYCTPLLLHDVTYAYILPLVFAIIAVATFIIVSPAIERADYSGRASEWAHERVAGYFWRRGLSVPLHKYKERREKC